MEDNFIHAVRIEIEKIDENIVNQLVQRIELVKQISLYKREHQLEIFDAEREQYLMSYYKLLSKKNSLNPKFVMELFKLIINYSKVIQSQIMDDLVVDV